MTLRYGALVERRLSGEACARMPVLFWKHHPVFDQSGEDLCRETLAFQDRFDCDLIKISPAATYQLPDYGLQDAWRGDPIGRRVVTRTVIEEPDDWRRLPLLDPSAGFLGQFGLCARRVRAASAATTPVIITVFDPLFQALTLAGEGRIQQHLDIAPDAVAEGLARITENTLAWIRHLKVQGVDGVFLASQHAMRSVFSEPLFARFGMPAVRACLEMMRGLDFNMVHVHGSGVHADLFAALTGVTIHYDMWADNPAPSLFLEAGCAVASGPSPALLASAAEDSEVLACCEALRAAGSRTLLSPGCSTPLAVGEARLRLLSQAA